MRRKALRFIFPLLVLYSFVSCKKDDEPNLTYGPFNYGKITSIQCNGYVVVKLQPGNGEVISHTRGMQVMGMGGSLLLNGGGELTIGIENITISMNGGGGVTNADDYSGPLTAHNITISGQGGNVNLNNLDLDSTISVSIQNTGDYTLKGRCSYLTVSNTNLGRFFGFDLTSDSCRVSQYSMNQIQVNTSQKLTGTIVSTGSVYYKGSPAVVNVSQIGTGQLIPY